MVDDLDFLLALNMMRCSEALLKQVRVSWLAECAAADTDCKRRDLTLVLDSSKSLTDSDWTKLKSFVVRLVYDLRRRSVLSRVAVVKYTQRASVALPLTDRDINDLMSLSFTSGHGRNVAAALRLTRTSVSRPTLLDLYRNWQYNISR